MDTGQVLGQIPTSHPQYGGLKLCNCRNIYLIFCHTVPLYTELPTQLGLKRLFTINNLIFQ